MKTYMSLTMIFLLAAPALAFADKHLVNSDGSGDFPTIQAAIDASAPGDSVLLGDGEFMGPGNRQLDIPHPLLLASLSGEPALCIIDAEGEPLGHVENETAIDQPSYRFQGITFRDGQGFTTEDGKDFFFSSCHFESCAGIFFSSPIAGELTQLDMEACDVLACSASTVPEDGNLIYATSVEVRDSRFRENLGSPGANFIIYAQIIALDGCDFERNGLGAPFTELAYARCFNPWGETADINVVDCRFIENVTWACLGVMQVYPSIARVERCRFEGNDNYGTYFHDPSGGGASDAEIRDCLFAGNGNAAIVQSSMNLSLEGCTFVNGGGSADLIIHTTNGGHNQSIDRCIFAFRTSGHVMIMPSGDAVGMNIACTTSYGYTDGYGYTMDSWIGLNGNIVADPKFCDWTGGDYTLYSTSPCLPAGNDCGLLMGAEGQGCVDLTALEPAPAMAAELRAHPNPFNPSTRIFFGLPAAGPVTLSIHEVSGRRVTTLLDAAPREAGAHAIDWRADGLPSGVYLARLEFAGGFLTEKLILLR